MNGIVWNGHLRLSVTRGCPHAVRSVAKFSAARRRLCSCLPSAGETTVSSTGQVVTCIKVAAMLTPSGYHDVMTNDPAAPTPGNEQRKTKVFISYSRRFRVTRG